MFGSEAGQAVRIGLLAAGGHENDQVFFVVETFAAFHAGAQHGAHSVQRGVDATVPQWAAAAAWYEQIEDVRQSGHAEDMAIDIYHRQ